MRPTKFLAAGLIAALAACAPILSRVSIRGSQNDLSAIAGKWNGEYRNPDLGRNGSILFHFASPEDVAYGDVAMTVPVGESLNIVSGEPSSHPRFQSQILKIKFVNVVNGEIFGVLEPYTDPACECIVRTTFTGHFDGTSTIRGTFSTTSLMTSGTRTGTWKVTRN